MDRLLPFEVVLLGMPTESWLLDSAEFLMEDLTWLVFVEAILVSNIEKFRTTGNLHSLFCEIHVNFNYNKRHAS